MLCIGSITSGQGAPLLQAVSGYESLRYLSMRFAGALVALVNLVVCLAVGLSVDCLLWALSLDESGGGGGGGHQEKWQRKTLVPHCAIMVCFAIHDGHSKFQAD